MNKDFSITDIDAYLERVPFEIHPVRHFRPYFFLLTEFQTEPLLIKCYLVKTTKEQERDQV